MSKSTLLRTAAVFLLAGASYAGLARAAAPAVPFTPAASSPCSTPDFLLAPPLGAMPAQTSALCGCGDAVCKGLAPFSNCGSSVRVCVDVGSCPSIGGGGTGGVVTRNCVCVTKDPG